MELRLGVWLKFRIRLSFEFQAPELLNAADGLLVPTIGNLFVHATPIAAEPRNLEALHIQTAVKTPFEHRATP